MVFRNRKHNRLDSFYHRVVVDHDGTAIRGDGKIFDSLKKAIPKGWSFEAVGEALDFPPRVINQGEVAKAAKRRRGWVSQRVEYPDEYLAYNDRKVAVTCKRAGRVPTGALITGPYGDTVIERR